ncbi:MAG: hypothetical protein AB7S26_36695 [Sandaracinaceae bacterium]
MFAVGINYPWVTCGHDFGPRPAPWGGAPPTDWDEVERTLVALAQDGIRSVRWWILGGGVNLPPEVGPSSIARREPWLEPWGRRAPLVRWRRRTPERWVPFDRLPALERGFIADVERLLLACRRSGVRLWPSLVSFELFLPIEDQVGGVTSRGLSALALGERMHGFLDATLEPLLDVCARYADAIEAFEVANEPGWALVPNWEKARWGSHPAWVSAIALSDFLVEGARRIAARGLLATIGFLDADPSWLPPSAKMTLRRLAERGAYRHQTHHYPSVTGRARLPHASEAISRPCWVGELATSRHGAWKELGREEQGTFLERRLALVRDRGYEGALLWAYRAEDPHVDWSDSVRAQVRRFCEAERAA